MTPADGVTPHAASGVGIGIGFLAVLAFLMWGSNSWASWEELNSKTNRNLIGVQFPVDSSTGYVVGAKGKIIKTTNAGSTWKSQQTPTQTTLRAVHFPADNTTGYAVGSDGVILKTTNGGDDWTAQSSGTTNHLYTVYFPVDATTGYVGGLSSTILKTTDGGANWTPLTFSGGAVMALSFPEDALTGYAAVTFGTIGEIYKTTDGGLNWSQQLALEDQIMESLQFPVDNTTGYFSTWNSIYKTVDGGVTWTPQAVGLSASPLDLHFPVDDLTGVAVGVNSAIYSTTDGGATWSEAGAGTNGALNGVYFADNQTGYAVGSGGDLIKTTDGGGGNTFVDYLHPIANGSVSDFGALVGCGAEWDCVNDQPGNADTGAPVAPTILTYIGDGQGHRAMFALADGVIPANHQITAIRVVVALTQIGSPRISISYQRLGVDPSPIDTPDFFGTAEFCCSVYDMDVTGLDWTPADIDALEIGIKHVSGSAVEVEQIYVKVFYEPMN